MIVERSMNDALYSNCYLVLDGPGGGAVVIDAGPPVEPLIAAALRHGVTPSHILLTHHHADHVAGVATLVRQWPGLEVLIHPLERELVADVTGTIDPGEVIVAGALSIHALHTPGHTRGMLSFLVDGPVAAVFTGDTLFRDSVGGVRAPGHDTYQALKDSIMGTLMELPRDTTVYPGHSASTTVAREWQENPFIRLWRGLDDEGTERCIVGGEPATLILLARDYDGGHKAWVRWPDGSDDIVPGSRVERLR
ncbi:MAG: MBL fold metallo-hydrolase [Solirubrobacteraceae bacterium]|jgi:glyoxylase-like metal-dependent hydrolase (beta-lactamase superfamily II)